MNSNKVLILGADEKRSNLLVSLFKEKDIEVLDANNLPDADSIISSSDLDLILIEYQSIVNAEREKLIELFRDARRTKFVIFDVPHDAVRRLAFYKLGAYRILGINYDVEDIYFFSENLLSSEKPSTEEKETRFSGRLQDFSLSGLINNFGKEKRSGVLRIQTSISSGKIYFNNGHIYHASAGYLKDDEAVLYMLTWNQGRFMMTPLPRKKVTSRVKLSNVGLLLKGETFREDYSKLIKELGGLSKEMHVINQGDLIQKDSDSSYSNFIEKLSDYRQINDVIENSPYGMLETLNQLITLKKSKNLKIRETDDVFNELKDEQTQETSGLVERLLSNDDVTLLRKNLQTKDLTSGKLLVLGSNTCGKTDFIRQFNQGSVSGVRSNQELDFTTIELAENFALQVFGIALEERLSQIIEKLSEDLLGYIFLIDGKRESELEYTNYVINNLIAVHQVPWTIAVTNLGKSAKNVPSKIKSNFDLPKGKSLILCDVTNKEDVRKVVLSIKSIKSKK
jgi:signal recognition particle receptor subunit beta